MAIEFLKPLYPPHPLEECEITLEINLRGEMARRVIEHAERLSRAPVELMADIVERVLADEVYFFEPLEKEISVEDMQKIVDANEKLVNEMKDGSK